MPPNHAHKSVLSSAMYYENLNIILKASKKLLTIKSVKLCLNTCSIIIFKVLFNSISPAFHMHVF